MTPLGRGGIPWVLGLGIFFLQIAAMPAETLPADPWVPRAEAEVLLRHGRWGLTSAEAASWGGLMDTPGQYFFQNPDNGRFFSKYGVLNTVLSIPPLLLARALGPSDPSPQRFPLILNLYNGLATALLGVVFFLLARRYTTDASAVLWALAALYSGFLWFYTRAQSAEVWQVLLYTTGVWAMVRAREDWERRPIAPVAWLMMAGAAVSGLFLLRFTYGLLFPWLVGGVLLSSRGRDFRRAVMAVAIPLGATLGVWMITNTLKFGGPFTTGYGAWLVDGRPHDRLDLTVFPQALLGFLFSPQRSVGWHYPMLVLAIFGAGEFYRRFRKDALMIGGAVAGFLLLFSLSTNWESHAAYGPRYLLPFLPAASLPVLMLWRRTGVSARWGRSITAILLVGSFWLQTEVNAQPFFLPYRLAGPFAQYGDERINRYFARRPYALIDRDVRRFVEGRAPFPPLEWLREKRGNDPSGEAVFVAGRVRALAERNYYWASHRGAAASLGDSR